MAKKVQTKILNYRVIIEKEYYPDGTLVYTAFVPTLGVTDYGPTIDKVLKSLKDGIELAVECLVEAGFNPLFSLSVSAEKLNCEEEK